MEWISQNWVWVLFAGGMIAMHLFGHGSHGGHGGHGGHCGYGGHGGHDDRGDGRNDTTPEVKDSVRRTSEQKSGHHH